MNQKAASKLTHSTLTARAASLLSDRVFVSGETFVVRDGLLSLPAMTGRRLLMTGVQADECRSTPSPAPVTRTVPPADAVQRASQAAQQAIRSKGVRYERDLVHPEGADLDKVLRHRASPEVLARVRERQLQDLTPDPDFEARRARVFAETQAEIVRETARAPTPLPPDPTKPKLTGLEAALADLGRRMGLKPPNSPS